MGSVPEPIKQLIRKIHTLSLRGVGGEADTAKRKLDKLLATHNIALEDIIRDSVKTYKFRYKSDLERRLILQCYYSLRVKDEGTYSYYKGDRKSGSCIGLDLTPAQYIDLQGMVGYYKGTLKKEVERLFVAFVHKHRLFAASTDDDCKEDKPLNLDELAQLLAMMQSLGEKSYLKPAGLLTT